MRWCAHADEVEDLAIGALPQEQVARVQAHAAACPECRAQFALLREERELFVRRARVAPAMPPNLADVMLRVDQRRRVGSTPRSRTASRLAIAAEVLAAAACVVLAIDGGNAWSLLGLRAQSSDEVVADDDLLWDRPPLCERESCNQSSLFANDCEPVTCWLPSAFAAKREANACSQPSSVDWEGARCEPDGTRNQ